MVISLEDITFGGFAIVCCGAAMLAESQSDLLMQKVDIGALLIVSFVATRYRCDSEGWLIIYLQRASGAIYSPAG